MSKAKSSAAYAGMQLQTINNLTKYGVTIEGPLSSGFKEKVAESFSAPTHVESDLEKYSVVLSNRSPQHVLAMTVVWRFEGAAGKSIPHITTIEAIDGTLNNVSHNLIQAGTSRAFCLLANNGGLDTPYGQATTIKDDEYTQSRRNQLNDLLARSTKWSIEIDSILLSNGLFVGRDTAGRFDTLKSKIQGARDLAAELQGKSNDAGSFLAHAQAVTGVSREDLEKKYLDIRARLKSPAYFYEESRRQFALRVLAERNSSGQAAALDFVNNSLKNQVAIVRKTD
jgi:hypothetical protein